MLMRDYKTEFEARVAWIKRLVEESRCRGIVFGNSGGKDSALVGLLCKAACENTVGIIMPCNSKRNYGEDADHAKLLADFCGIESRCIDLSGTCAELREELEKSTALNSQALTNLAPRLRMTSLYAVAAAEGLLVAGTGNRSEIYMGYFTKWGDGACDFNPISDLSATEVFEFLDFLGAPREIIDKAPSAGLYEGQTDEQDMGVSYAAIDRYITTGEATEHDRAIIDRYHAVSAHKRRAYSTYK